MNVTELRIGNFIANKNLDNSVQIGTISDNGTIKIDFGVCKNVFTDTMNLSAFEPIKLNEKWLNNFGFEKIDNHRFKIKMSEYFDSYYTFSIHDHTFRFYTNEISVCLSTAFYVHELQNLFFFLTKRELAIA